MSDETIQPPPTNVDKPKRIVHRKPLWLCIPLDFEEVASTDPDTGDVVSRLRPTRYTIEKCSTKGEVKKLLEQHKIDPARPEQYDHLLIFRAEPLELQLSQQVLLRF